MTTGEGRRENDMTGGGWTPRPDPTVLTDAAIVKAVHALTDYINGQLAVRDERLRGIDEATKLRLSSLVDHSPEIDIKVAHLQGLHDEKFGSVQTQFRERDTRAEREARDNTKAVDAAFAAQKDQAAREGESNQKAIDKSEKATAEKIDKLGELFTTTIRGLDGKIDDLKERVGRIESIKVGATENRTGLYATIGIVSTVFFLIMGILGFLAVSPR